MLAHQQVPLFQDHSLLFLQVPLLLLAELRAGQFPLQELEVPQEKESLSLQDDLLPVKEVNLKDHQLAMKLSQDLDSPTQPPGSTPHRKLRVVHFPSNWKTIDDPPYAVFQSREGRNSLHS